MGVWVKQGWVCSLSVRVAVGVGLCRSVERNFSTTGTSPSVSISNTSKKKKKEEELAKSAVVKEKRRTRSNNTHLDCYDFDSLSSFPHIPVLLPDVLDSFSSSSSFKPMLRPLSSFVDCTLGAAGHSSAIIREHSELRVLIGMDVDPLAHEIARPLLLSLSSHLKLHTLSSNFRYIRSVLFHLGLSSVDGILMDLGLSSMQVNNPDRGFAVLNDGPLDMRMDPQASLKAEDILNSWPDAELGRVLREYGEESNWHLLQKRIVKARLCGGLHSTGELVDLIRTVTPGTRGGRQGWIKTATRVFQALRIAVNDELRTLKDSLYACFECLAPGGRLAVISFHSLEDRIVKQAFLDIIECDKKDGEEMGKRGWRKVKDGGARQVIRGRKGTILTKRPITPSEDEERLNRRSRSAKLRVIEKVED